MKPRILAGAVADQEYWDDQFLRGAVTPISWQSAARDLISTANIVRRVIEQRNLEMMEGLKAAKQAGQTQQKWCLPPVAPAFMLYAFAVENLAKAILVAKGTPSTSGLRLAENIKGHRLRDLVSRTGMVPAADQNVLLDKMERFVERGRYPVQAKPHQQPYADGISIPTDFSRALSLLEELETLLRRVSPCALGAEALGDY